MQTLGLSQHDFGNVTADGAGNQNAEQGTHDRDRGISSNNDNRMQPSARNLGVPTSVSIGSLACANDSLPRDKFSFGHPTEIVRELSLCNKGRYKYVHHAPGLPKGV
jgi:hypothetical protein